MASISCKTLESSGYSLLGVPKGLTPSTAKSSYISQMQYIRAEDNYRVLLDSLPPIVDVDNGLVGIEIEVENISFDSFTALPAGWMITKDQSLRNSGAEFISVPLHTSILRESLTALYLTIQRVQRKKADFSWRTSIHTHDNVRKLTESQIAAYVSMYLMFEQPIFGFVGDNRPHSNFCVPLYETTTFGELAPWFSGEQNVAWVSENWHKYTALNLLPVCGASKYHDSPKSPKGTIEWRHLKGTPDLVKLVEWQNIILSIHKYAQATTLDLTKARINQVRSPRAYAELKQEIFGTALSEKMPLPDSRFPYPCVTFVKDCFSHRPPAVPEDLTETGLGEMIKKRYVEDPLAKKSRRTPSKSPPGSVKKSLKGGNTLFGKTEPFSPAHAEYVGSWGFSLNGIKSTAKAGKSNPASISSLSTLSSKKPLKKPAKPAGSVSPKTSLSGFKKKGI